MYVITADVAVIGAGPAGSATAAFLARRDYDVVLLDHARFPKPKTYGDYLTTGAAPGWLERAGERLRRSGDLTERILRTIGDLEPPRVLFTRRTLESGSGDDLRGRWNRGCKIRGTPLARR